MQIISLTNIFLPSGKLNKAQSRPLSCFFTLNIWRQSFLLLRFTIFRLFFTLWQAWMPGWPVLTSVCQNTLSTLSSSASSFTEVGISTNTRHSRREYWGFARHYFSVLTNRSTNLKFTFLVSATSASSF